MSLIFIRHFRPDVADGMCYGQTDLDLLPEWKAGIQPLSATLPKGAPIVSSPLKRCRDMAVALARAGDHPITIDTDLTEMDFGTWEMRPWDDIPRAELDAWADDLLKARPHGGETVAEVRNRAQRAVARIGKTPTILISHAGIYKTLLSLGDHPDPWNARIGYGETRRLPFL